MFEQAPLPKKIKWQLMYEGPALGHLLAYQLFIRPFMEGKKSLPAKLTGLNYDYYLWYSDRSELGGLHSGYYSKSDLDSALKRGEVIYFDKNWLNKWYALINDDCDKAEKLMRKAKLEKKIGSTSRADIIKLIPKLIETEYRLVSYVRCSQPQLTDAMQNRLFAIIRKHVKNKSSMGGVFTKLTLPEEMSLFTEEEIAWLGIIIEAKNKINGKDINYITSSFLSENYREILALLEKHLKKYELLPASDRTPTWDLNHFIELLKTNLKSNINYSKKRKHIVEQYENAPQIKEEIVKKYKLPHEAIVLGRRIAKVGFYRFKASFYWRWIGYYMVLICKKYARRFGLTYEEIACTTKEELLEMLSGRSVIEKEELIRRSEAELYLHYEGGDYIWWGKEAVQKKIEIFGATNFDEIVKLKGEIGSIGKVRGKAFVFYWSDNISKKVHRMPIGSILVAPQTHPTYMPAIRLAAGLVCDEGGVTGHAAIVSRELNKPCVIGVHIGTKVIKTGDEIEIDGDRGIVKVLGRIKH
ncbi:MAG TPA: PEP-utilizing enzyme [Patescibacteria group bacterium]|nr:PEP-utilizing enzyme [Patescibacteria group bacterium]